MKRPSRRHVPTQHIDPIRAVHQSARGPSAHSVTASGGPDRGNESPPPVGLEFFILALIPRFGNVAPDAASRLR